MFLHRTIGNHVIQGLLQASIVQAKPKIGPPGNSYEQEADQVSEQVMRTPDVDPETLAQIGAENPYLGTRVQEITNAPELFGRIPLPIPYYRIDPGTVNVVDVWGLGCGPCQDAAQSIIAVSQMPEFSGVRFYHLCVARFPDLRVSAIPMIFVLLGRNLRFYWDGRSLVMTWLISKLRPLIR